MVFEAVSLVHHHVVPLDVVQDGGVLQDQLIGCDQYLQPLPAPPFKTPILLDNLGWAVWVSGGLDHQTLCSAAC